MYLSNIFYLIRFLSYKIIVKKFSMAIITKKMKRIIFSYRSQVEKVTEVKKVSRCLCHRYVSPVTHACAHGYVFRLLAFARSFNSFLSPTLLIALSFSHVYCQFWNLSLYFTRIRCLGRRSYRHRVGVKRYQGVRLQLALS